MEGIDFGNYWRNELGTEFRNKALKYIGDYVEKLGEVNVNAVGSAQDYTVSVSKGAGDVTVNGTKVSHDTTVGSGQHKIELNGGIGEASISFTE